VSTRQGGRPSRRVSNSPPRRQILVFVEGLKTEERYLVDWYRRNRDHVIVIIDQFRGGPLELVRRASEARRIGAREERRGKGRAYDEIWCMFDIDEHPNVPEAIDLARRNDIRLAISNPCLELWFILHFEDQTAWIHRHDAQHRSEHLLGCTKVLTDGALRLLFEHHEAAAQRARGLDEKHEIDGSPPGENPSSGAWRLTESIAAT
jgi:hypothetical protein